MSGTSDPVCHVDVLGKKKNTSVKYNTLGCVFDEILFFNFKNIGRNELKNAAIKVREIVTSGRVDLQPRKDHTFAP